MGTVVLDASVLAALMNTRDVHHPAAQRLLAAQRTDARYAVGASAYAEILVRAARHGTSERVDAALDRFGVEVVAVDRPAARAAAFLRAGGRSPAIKLPDALAVSVALVRSPPLAFLTFDERLARRYAAETGNALPLWRGRPGHYGAGRSYLVCGKPRSTLLVAGSGQRLVTTLPRV